MSDFVDCEYLLPTLEDVVDFLDRALRAPAAIGVQVATDPRFSPPFEGGGTYAAQNGLEYGDVLHFSRVGPNRWHLGTESGAVPEIMRLNTQDVRTLVAAALAQNPVQVAVIFPPGTGAANPAATTTAESRPHRLYLWDRIADPGVTGGEPAAECDWVQGLPFF